MWTSCHLYLDDRATCSAHPWQRTYFFDDGIHIFHIIFLVLSAHTVISSQDMFTNTKISKNGISESIWQNAPLVLYTRQWPESLRIYDGRGEIWNTHPCGIQVRLTAAWTTAETRNAETSINWPWLEINNTVLNGRTYKFSTGKLCWQNNVWNSMCLINHQTKEA